MSYTWQKATPPTVIVTSNSAALLAGQTATITFTLSKPSANFIATDVVATNGTISNFAQTANPLVYTATFTPSINTTGLGTVTVPAGAFSDATGNTSLVGSVSLALNTVAPTVTIVTTKTLMNLSETALVRFTLSAASTTFGVGDVVVSGGTLSGFTGSGTNYTAVFTPAAGATLGLVSVPAAQFTDADGNGNLAGAIAEAITIDSVAPTITISSNVTTLGSGQTATITFTLSEASAATSTFTAADVIVTGGTLAGFIPISPTVYTATLTPAAGFSSAVIAVPAGAFADAAGNANAAAGTLTVAIDTVAPTVIVTSDKASLANGATATITFTLSKASANFIATDVVATNGTISNFVQTANPLVYTATFTPNTGSVGVATVTVAAGSFTDASGNANFAGSLSLQVDTIPPTITAAGITAAASVYRVGNTLAFSVPFSEVVNVVGTPTLNVFIGTGASETLRQATYVAGTGTNTLTFHYTISSGDTNDVDGIRIQQIVLPAGATIRDAVGNDATLAVASPLVGGNVFVMTQAAKATFELLPNPLLSPRSTPVSVIKVIFDHPVPYVNNTDVSGWLSLADFELTRNGVVVPFPAGARLTQSSGFNEFEISNLSGLTEPVGTYILTFSDAQIGDRSTVTWIKTFSTPGELTAGISLSPTSNVPRRIPADTATIAFSQPVINVDLADFVFRKNGVVVPWTGTPAVLSGSGDTYVISGLTTMTNEPGSTYEITLLADDVATPAIESDIVTLAGGTLIAPVSVRWTFEPPVAITTVTPVAVPPSGYFRVGDVMEFSVKFSEKVFVTNPQFLTMPILLGTGTNVITVQAGYVRGDATDTLVFRYQPQPTDQDLDGVLLTGSLSLGTGTNLGTIKDSAGIDAVLAYTQPNTTSLRIDSRSPQITSFTPPANGTYGIGESLIFSVTFDEAVTYTGTPRIPLVIGTKTVYADVIAGQETPTLIFQYVIQPGDNDTNGIVGSNQIALNGGTVSDIAGNPAILTFAAIPNLSNVLVDTAPPAAPVILQVIANNTGAEVVVPIGGSTPDNTLKLVGTAEAGSTVTVFLNGAEYGNVVVPASGVWQFTTFTLASNLPAGNAYTFTALATDAKANVGPLSSPYAVTVDTTPPTAPTVNPLVTINPRPTVTGTAKLLAGETLTVTIVVDAVNNLFVTYPVPVDAAGNWSLDLSTVVPTFLPLAEGTYSVTATVTDAAGNATIDGTTSELKVDTSPVTVNPLQTNNPKPTITGTAVIPTGGRLEVTVNGQTYAVVPAADGTWSLDLAAATPAFTALADGVYAITATIYDAGGISISDPTTNELQIDTTGPSVISVDSLTADGFYKAFGVVSIQIRLSDAVTVDTTIGSPLLALNTGRNAIYDPTSSTPTVLTFLYTVQAGDNTADLDYASPSALSLNGATIRDAAGNNASLGLPVPGTSGSLGFNRSITIDTIAPSPAPTVTPLTTTNTLPTVTGTATLGIGERLQVTVNGTTYDVLPDINGRWSLDLQLASPIPGSPQLQPLTSGLRYNVIATVIDQAGNATSDPTTNELSINTVAPVIVGAQDDVAPVLTTVASGGRINDPTPTLVGSAEANRLITVSVATGGGAAVVIGTTNSDAQGNWTFTPSSTFADGTYTFTVESSVAGGGTPVKSLAPFTVTIDTASATIASVAVPAGVYRAGQTVPFTVTFTEPVFVVGSPTLNVLIGTGTAAIARTATYVSGNGTSNLVFHYTLQATDNNDVDGVQVVSLTLTATDTIRDAAANDAVLAISSGVVPGNVFLMPKDATATFTLFPSARVNPRATPVSVIRVVFDNPVPFVVNGTLTDGVDAPGQLSLDDFELTRNGNVIALPAVARLIPGSGFREFEISNLSGVTETIGTYTLTFADLKIGGHQQFTWSKTEATPLPLTASLVLTPASGGSPRVTPVDSVTVTFSENVDNVDLSDFEFRANGVVVPWSGTAAVLSANNAGSVYTISGLTALTSSRTTYELRLKVSNISSYTGGQLIGDVATSWTYAGATRIGGVTAPTPPSSGFFKKGDVMNFAVHFSDPVFVPNTAGVVLPVTIGSNTVNADYVGGTGTATLAFRYTVQTGDEDRDGILLLGAVTAPSGAIKDATGANAELTFSPPDTSMVFVDAVNPTLNATVTGPANGTYVVGSYLTFTATFSEPMLVSGSPRIALTIGNATRHATYAAGAETRVLVFEYQVQAGDSDLNGIVAATTISLNGGSITDLAGNTGGLTFSPLNTTGVIVDAVQPVITRFSVPASTPDGAYRANQTIPIEATVSRAVVAGSQLHVILDTGAPPVTLTAQATGTKLQGNYEIGPGENSLDLTVVSFSNISIVDTVGNGLGSTVVPSGVNNIAGARAIVIDTRVPDAPTLALAADTGVSNSDGITSNGSVNVTGIEVNSTWEFSTNGGSTWNRGSGASFTLPAGTYAAGVVQVRQTDLAGNTSTAGVNTVGIVVDKLPPTAPTFDGIAGTVLSGRAEAGAVVTILNGGVPVSTTPATIVAAAGNGSTAWTATLSLADGPYTLTATATDAAGNKSDPSSGYQVIIDSDPPVVPAVLSAIDGVNATPGDTIILSGGFTNDTTPTFTGTAAPGVILTIWDGPNTVLGQTRADSDGSWRFITPGVLAEGTHSVTARVSSRAGTVAKSAAYVVVIDTTPPDAPSLALVSDTGASSLDGVTTNGIVSVSGVEASAAWEFSTNGGGSWTRGTGSTFTLPAGTYAAGVIQVRQTDLAGNTGAAGTNAAGIVVDKTFPAAPTLWLVSDTGASASDGVTNNGLVAVSGIEANASWEFSTNGGGSWSRGTGASFTLPAGTYAAGVIQVRQTNLAGNTSATASTAAGIDVDNTAPVAPTLALANDTGASGSDGVTTDGLVTVSGVAANAMWEFSTNGGGSWNPGTASFFTLPAGTYAAGVIRVRQTDLAGNTSTAGTNARQIEVDTIAPAAPTFALAYDTGTSNADGVTTNGLVAVNGIAANGTWEFSANSGASWTQGTGASFTLPAGTYAAGVIQVRQTDLAGNASSSSSNPVAIVIDKTPPNTPAITAAMDDVLQYIGSVANGGATNDPTPTLSGTAEAGAQVTVLDGAAVVAIVTADGSGRWTATTTALAQGLHVLTARATDAAGNPSGSSSAYRLTVDTATPVPPTITSVESDVPPAIGAIINGGRTNDRELKVSGTTEPNGRVTFWTNYGTPQAVNRVVMADAQGRWSATTPALSDGLNSFVALVRDAASNRSNLSAVTNVIVDTTGPVVQTAATPLASGTYGIGQVVDIQVQFSEAIAVTGAPTLLLNTTPARMATYAGSSANVMTFRYTAVTGDSAGRLDYGSAAAISLNGGTIRDLAGNNALLTLPAPGLPGSLGAGKTIAIDAAIKAIAGNLTASVDTAPLVNRSKTSIPVTFNTPVTGVTLEGIKLFYEGRSVSLTGATITGSGRNYTLTLPSTATSLRGTYRLRIGGSMGGIVGDGVSMATPTNLYWKRS